MTENEKKMAENPEAAPDFDLSKVANLNTLDARDKEALKSNVALNPRRAQKRKFCFQEPQKFPLPSKGKFYQDSPDEDLRNGFIKLYPMSVADEETLTNKAYLKNNSMLRVLFETCMASDYDARKLLSFDSMYIMYLLRSISYGNVYDFTVSCKDCGKKFDFSLDINDIEWAELPDDEPDEREIVLPVSKYVVTMPLPRIGMDETIERIRKQNEKNRFLTENSLLYCSRTTSIKDPDGNEIDPRDWVEFFSTIPVKDRVALNQSFEKVVNSPKISVVCPECGNEIEMDIPLEASFFRA